MLVLGVSVVAHIAFWVQEVVWILLVHDCLLYALVGGVTALLSPSYVFCSVSIGM